MQYTQFFVLLAPLDSETLFNWDVARENYEDEVEYLFFSLGRFFYQHLPARKRLYIKGLNLNDAYAMLVSRKISRLRQLSVCKFSW